MVLSRRAKHLRRYGDIIRLLSRHGGRRLVRHVGLDAFVDEIDEEEATASAEELAADLEAMGPTFVKLGQLLSTRADLVSAPYAAALSRLQDHVEPFSFEEVGSIVEEELGVRVSKAFASFEPVPLASASLGQVHRAELRSGRQVVVKVQRPGVRQQVAEDMEVLAELAHLADEHTDIGRRYGFAEMVDQFRRSLEAELDYRREASNLVRLRNILAHYDRLVVPEPVPDFTTSRVLTMDYLPGRKVTDLGPLRRLEIDGRLLADQLFQAYLRQILVEGFFHADPHPGNVLLTDDGRLGLIDVGMVARVSKPVRELLVRFLLALSDGDAPAVTEVTVALGDPLPDFDRRGFGIDVSELVEDSADRGLGELNVGMLMMSLLRSSAERGLRLPAELSMLGKALLNLDEVAETLDGDFVPGDAIRAHTYDILQGQIRGSSGSAFTALLDAKNFAEQLPGRLNRVLDALAEGQFQLNVRAFDEVELLRGLQKLANRVTTGLVLAALVVMAALLVRAPASSKVLGYPPVAVFCFIAASAGAVALLVSAARSDHRVRTQSKTKGRDHGQWTK